VNEMNTNFYFVLGILVLGIAAGMVIDAANKTPVERATDACHATCGYHGVQEFTMTPESSACICNH